MAERGNSLQKLAAALAIGTLIGFGTCTLGLEFSWGPLVPLGGTLFIVSALGLLAVGIVGLIRQMLGH